MPANMMSAPVGSSLAVSGSSIATAEPAGTDVAMPLYTGPCSTLTIPWAAKQGD